MAQLTYLEMLEGRLREGFVRMRQLMVSATSTLYTVPNLRTGLDKA